jgi:hypothetical protein
MDMASRLSREAERIAADYSREHEAPLGDYAMLQLAYKKLEDG